MHETRTPCVDRLQLFAHRGTPQVEPNSIAALDAAAAAGADAIEFDVLAVGRRLVLAHTPVDALRRRRRLVTLADAAAHLNAPAFDDIHFNVDLKAPGYERATVDCLDGAGLVDRCIFSSQFSRSLRAVKEHRPEARTGLSVGGGLARAAHRWPRGGLIEAIVERALRTRCDAVMLFHELASHRLVDALEAARVDLVCWTVNCPDRAAELRDLGVSSLTTDDLGALRAVAW